MMESYDPCEESLLPEGTGVFLGAVLGLIMWVAIFALVL